MFELKFYTAGERDLVRKIIDALHVGNDGISLKDCATEKDDNGMTYYHMCVACPPRREADVRTCLANALKAYNF